MFLNQGYTPFHDCLSWLGSADQDVELMVKKNVKTVVVTPAISIVFPEPERLRPRAAELL